MSSDGGELCGRPFLSVLCYVDERQQQIVEDLTGALEGEIRCDAVSTAIYAMDASLYHLRPLGVAWPKHADDVGLLARYAAEQNLPLVPRGAGSGVAGAAVGTGLIVDFSRHMTRLLADDGDTIRVEPGVVLERLNRRLAASGRYFPPDPAMAAITTLGGMIATNAAGSHSLAIGTTREHVASLAVVLAGGAALEAMVEPRPSLLETLPLPEAVLAGDDDTKLALLARLTRLLGDHADLITARRPQAKRNNCGYHVWDVLTADQLDLPGLLVGSEGTLAMTTAATLRVSPRPAHRGVALLLFGRIEAAIEAVSQVLPLRPAACDLLDRRLLSLAREGDPRFERLIVPEAEAALLIEQTADGAADIGRRLGDLIAAALSVGDATIAARATTAARPGAVDDGPSAIDFLWTLPGRVVPRLTQLKGLTRPLPFVEDVAVPPEAMQEFRVRAQKVFQKHQVTATLYAHAGDGQMHFRPFLPPPELASAAEAPPYEAIARDLYQVVLSLGGVVSGEHGDGLSRTAFIRSQYGPLYRVLQQVKEIFDPGNLLNPGKILSDDPKATVRHLRPPNPLPPVLTELKLRWTPEQMANEAARCNGCGNCRTQEPGLRMCPFFRLDQTEEAAPRSKANALRLAAVGQLTPEDLAGPEMARLASLCFNCKQCERECPSQVPISHLVLEAKAARVAAEGLDWDDWCLARTHVAGPVGSGFAFATNRLLSSPAARWLVEKTVGLSRYRKLPTFARRPFLRNIPRQCRTLRVGPNGEKAVVYFVDQFANFFDPDLARAAIAVIERQGVPVYVPTDQVVSGMSLISAGDLDEARELAEENLRVLAPLAREGHTIVCTEPSAAVCLKHEYPLVVDHPEVETVAARTVEAGAFLWGLHAAGRFDTRLHPLPLTLGYHAPCHLRTLAPEEPLRQLLGLIPELQVRKIDSGCSGMAGPWGLNAANFRTSLRIGWPLISAMRDNTLEAGVTECSSCRMQMEQGTSKPTLHPLKLLAAAYAGTVPPLAHAKGRLVMS